MTTANPVIGGRSRTSLLYASFGLSQASSTAVDILILLFAARVLLAPERGIALLDAVGTIGYTIVAVCFSFLWQMAPNKRSFIVAGFFGLSIPMFLFSSIGDLWMAYTLATMVGALMFLPAAMTGFYLSEAHLRSDLPSAYGKMGARGSLGGSLGLLLAICWLGATSLLDSQGLAERSLFIILGLLAVLSAVGVWRATGGMPNPRPEAGLAQAAGEALSSLRNRLVPRLWAHSARAPGLGEPLLNDNTKAFLFLMGLLHIGMGMSFTGTMMYLIGELKVLPYFTLLAVLSFRLAASMVSNPAGNNTNHLMALRFQQMATSWRVLAVLALGLVVWLPLGGWGVTAIIPLIAAFGVTSGIIGVTGPMVASAHASAQNQSRQNQSRSYLLFVAVSNGGAGVGALLVFLTASTLGFPALLGLSALICGIVLLLWHRA